MLATLLYIALVTNKRVLSNDKEGLSQLAHMCRAFKKDFPISLAEEDMKDVAQRLEILTSFIYASPQPEPSAERRTCFYNAIQKVDKSGGAVQWGWTLHSKMTANGPYAWINHHGIWISPEGNAIDVTPFPITAKDEPTLDSSGNVVFSPDSNASPWIATGILGTLPQRCVPLGKNPNRDLVAWLRQRDLDSQRELEKEIQEALRNA